MASPSRRGFLGSTASIGAAAALAPGAASVGRGDDGDEPVRFVLIGCGGRGKIVAYNMIDQGGKCVGLCDVKDSERGKINKFLDQHHDVGELPGHKYPEEVFDRDDVDAVIVATPDHWHAALTIQACQAGKDVYVEKPQAHNIWESRQMVAAARKYDRVVQVGTQNRSAEYNHKAKAYIDSGKIGPTHLVRVCNLKSNRSWRAGEASEAPKDLDWDRWLGPASDWPYHQRLFNGGWHGYWDFSGGDLCNDAIHQSDLALMLLGDPGLPKSVVSNGGRPAHEGGGEVPDLLMSHFEFDGFVLSLEHTNYPSYMEKTSSTIRRKDQDRHPHWLQNATRIEFYGRDQMMVVGRHGGGWQATTYPWQVQKQMFGSVPDGPHARNFLECVRSRERPNADIETLHPAVTMMHMANIAHRVGNRKLWWDEEAGRFDDEEANALIKRTYREGYEMPEKV